MTSFPATAFQMSPNFSIDERDLPTLGEVKVGQRLRMIINYQVKEKTRSFTILRITSAYPFPSKRKI